MPELRILSGKEIIKIFLSFDFRVAAQKGSHVKLTRIQKDRTKQTLTIPNHSEIDRGTLRAIYRQALRYVSEEKLKSRFYNMQ